MSREGDPYGAVAMAVASPRTSLDDGAASRWLAALLETRVRDQGVEVSANWDGTGLRISIPLSDTLGVERAVELLRDALHRPVSGEDVDAVRRILEGRRASVLAAPYVNLARCSGEPVIANSVAARIETTQLDELLVSSRRRGGVALGVVGTSDRTGALARAVDSTNAWRLEERTLPKRPLAATHAVTVAGAPHEDLTLDIAVPVADPRRALQLALQEELGRSPLVARLGVARSTFRLTRVAASARVDGGCLRLRLDSRGVPRIRVTREAAEVLAIVTDSLRADLETPLDPTVVARQILRTTDATATAELAAWWALAGASDASEGIVLSSVLAVPGERGDVAGTFDELEGAFRADIEAAAQRRPLPSMRGSKDEPRVALERGQGESWLLVANECALAKESEWDAGRSALVARLAASLGTLSGVVLEPWIEPAGVGILARTRQLPGETTAATGRRLGMMAGMALTSLSAPEERFARTKGEMLRHLSTPSARRIEGLLPRLEGLAPSWLRPEGLLERQLATSVEDIDERWRAMLREPWRAAMVASLDTDEAQAAFAEIARWIPMSDEVACTVAQPARSTSQAPERWLGSGVEPHAFVAIPGESSSEGPIAALVAAHLTTVASRVSAASHASIVGAGRKPTLVIEIVASGVEREAAVLAWRRELESLRTSALSEDALRRAQVIVSRERARALESPRGRVAALWRGDRVTPITAAEVREWMARHFVNERIQVLIGDTQAP